MVWRMFCISALNTVPSTALSDISPVISTRCTAVSRLRIISCSAFCSAGYPSYPSAMAKRTTVDSETCTLSPSFDAVINAALS